MASNASTPIKPSPTANTKPNRLPAPSLFVGPPSRNTSQLSISHQQPADPSLRRDPLHRGKLGPLRQSKTDDDPNSKENDDSANTKTSKTRTTQPHLKKASEKEVEAKWKEMQSTLNEVELTAQSSTHVFGESHARALDALRKAQIELARAWGRGNQDERDPTQVRDHIKDNVQLNRFKGAEDLAKHRADVHKVRGRGDTNTSTSTALSDESVRSGATSQSGRSQLEDETAQDIELASERRAANEAYFEKVDGGVKDVVKRLELVAEAMRGVESESRSLWSSSTEEESDERMGVGKSKADGKTRKSGRSGTERNKSGADTVADDAG